MKRKLALVMAILLVMGGVAFSQNISPGIGDKMGQGQFQSNPGKIFRMVRNILDTPLSTDDIVIWNLTEDDGVTIGVTTTSQDSAVAGILATKVPQRFPGTTNTAAQDIGKQNWGWLQTYGKAQVDIVFEVQTAGAAMGTGTTSTEAAEYRGHGGLATATAVNFGNAGFFYDTATAGDDNVECFLQID